MPLVERSKRPTAVVYSSWRRGGFRALRVGDWKLILHGWREGRVEELYDLVDDPGERRDLALDRRRVVDRLTRRLRRIEAASRELSEGVAAGPEVRPRKATRGRLRALGYLEER